MKIKNLYKHLKKVAYKKDDRPVLKCVHYDEDGSLAATDSERILIIKDFHNHDSSFNLNLDTFDLASINYPNLENIVPKNYSNEVTAKIVDLIDTMKLFSKEVVEWSITEKETLFKSKSGKTTSLKTHLKGDPIIFNADAQFVKECCEFFKDTSDQKANADITIKTSSATSPILFTTNEDKFVYLIVPKRG